MNYEERTQRILEKAAMEKRRRKKIKIASIAAGATALVLTLNLVLFVPYSEGGIDISKYKNSEYYSVIDSLSKLTYGKAETTNNFTEWFGSLGSKNVDSDYAAEPPTSGEMTTGSSQQYEETTNNQTDGVIEGDLIKRSDKFIYYLNYTPAAYDVFIDCTGGSETKVVVYHEATLVLNVYSIAGEQSQNVATFEIQPDEGTSFTDYENSRELFLSEDCNTVTVLTPCRDAGKNLSYTTLISVDVSDLENIHILNRVYLSGQYVSARLTDGNFLIVSDFGVKKRTDFSDEAQFVPQIGSFGQLESLPIGDIVLPDGATRAGYTVICSLNSQTLAVNDSVAFLSYSDEVYVSQNNLFVTRETTKEYDATKDPAANEEDVRHQLSYIRQVTEIVCVAYKEGLLTPADSITVNGTVNDRFSLDEYENVLRVFTTTGFNGSSYTYMTASEADPYRGFFKSSANLYCIDLSSFEVIASIENFAPRGESVKSARFDGNTAYVCTAEVTYGYVIDINDPVFAFDLSDYTHVTYTDTGTIPGYSLSLITFTGDTLLGIGYGDGFETLKIELYRETDSDVVSVATYELQNARFSDRFKAYFIDSERGFVGLAVNTYIDDVAYSYRLLRFDEDGLIEIMNVPLENLDDKGLDDMRATYIDGYLYLFGYNTFQVLPVLPANA